MINRIFVAFALLFLAFWGSSSASAQNREVPYWAVIRWSEMNMRVGPSAQYRIEWVYRREGLPVKIVRVVDGWRLIRDADGTQGWVVARSLRLERGGVIVGDGLAAMRDMPAANGRLLWKTEPGVVGKLGECEAGWCQFDVAGRKGWIEAGRLWGEGQP